MIILGIDPGFATIGYGVLFQENSTLKPIDFGVISTPKDEDFPTRLAMIGEASRILMEKFKPDCVALEELFFNTNITTGIKVAHARGVLIVNAIEHCGKLYEYTPLQVKKALTGNGRANKSQMQYMVKYMLGLAENPKPDDAADALAVAICHNLNFIKREV